ncbi:type I-B CRISPR-associated endonuclease Cas1b [Heyndrickxia coagulans]|uniref:type I-B CRISPR-associated endonuclease Cas1b n=1 Tax=Heyndrickxia TaxID=2837504 RepID=UPI000E47BD86|nr:type I-B CRISPR-associated endonuclease Cas1b [Heyndrickxia coagulans]MED4936332.1 type I-B CRISPR-associated endonuclease Cas1b [Heyndrickxia coagulans]RGR86072.1 type I-B CRISPR-associated endonuclease Cas1 [Heyndrickxia coagulans]RGR99877.1 type I-B CRISPR-associated endonuclease Cas1 [Heyndrickxia coagulans]
MRKSTKYLLSMGELKKKDNSLVFKNERGHTYIPIESVREIYCLNEISLNSKLFHFLSNAGVIVHFFNYYQQYSGTFYPKEQLVSGKLTVMQAKLFETKRLDVAKSIVNGIAKNIHYVLYHYYKHGKTDLKPYLDWLKKEVPKLLKKEISIKQILFIEGEIWRNFYGTFHLFLPESFVMNKRVRRPPDNPINALISFGNTILYSKTLSQIYRTHLNQTISYLHEPGESRFSLSLDLCEVFKPIIVFKTIFETVNNRKLQVGKHFDKDLNYALLNEAGRKVFIEALEERLSSVILHPRLKRKVTLETAIRLDAYKLIKYILEDQPFIPFNAKEMV